LHVDAAAAEIALYRASYARRGAVPNRTSTGDTAGAMIANVTAILPLPVVNIWPTSMTVE
jgi:hypothetical protein